MCMINTTFTWSTTAESTQSIRVPTLLSRLILPIHNITVLFPVALLDQFISHCCQAHILDELLADTDTHIPGFTRVMESWLTQPLKCKSTEKKDQLILPIQFQSCFLQLYVYSDYNTLEYTKMLAYSKAHGGLGSNFLYRNLALEQIQ